MGNTYSFQSMYKWVLEKLALILAQAFPPSQVEQPTVLRRTFSFPQIPINANDFSFSQEEPSSRYGSSIDSGYASGGSPELSSSCSPQPPFSTHSQPDEAPILQPETADQEGGIKCLGSQRESHDNLSSSSLDHTTDPIDNVRRSTDEAEYNNVHITENLKVSTPTTSTKVPVSERYSSSSKQDPITPSPESECLPLHLPPAGNHSLFIHANSPIIPQLAIDPLILDSHALFSDAEAYTPTTTVLGQVLVKEHTSFHGKANSLHPPPHSPRMLASPASRSPPQSSSPRSTLLDTSSSYMDSNRAITPPCSRNDASNPPTPPPCPGGEETVVATPSASPEPKVPMIEGCDAKNAEFARDATKKPATRASKTTPTPQRSRRARHGRPSSKNMQRPAHSHSPPSSPPSPSTSLSSQRAKPSYTAPTSATTAKRNANLKQRHPQSLPRAQREAQPCTVLRLHLQPVTENQNRPEPPQAPELKRCICQPVSRELRREEPLVSWSEERGDEGNVTVERMRKALTWRDRDGE